MRILQFIGGGVIALIAIGYFVGDDSVSGLEKVNILNHGNKITFDISNTSSKSGDVLVYVKSENGSARCVHVFRMQPGSIKELNVPCRSVDGGGQTSVFTRWVAPGRDEGLVKLAKRINLNWNK